MKIATTTAVLLFPALAFAAAVDEADFAAFDDSAEARDTAPTVARTDDGYIDVMCENSTLSDVLKQFRRATRMNILSGDSTNLNRRVSVSLTHVPWNSALESILGLVNFKMNERNGIWYVSEKTDDEVKNATRYYLIKHASAVDLADLFNGVATKTSYEERNSIRALSKAKGNEKETAADAKMNELKSAIAGRAKATAFPDTNTLVLTCPEANLFECEKIIKELDHPVTQVYIEARFIELSTEAMHKLGVQWDQLKSWGVSVKNVKAGYETSNGKPADYGLVTSQKTSNNNLTETITETSDETSSSSLSSDGESTASANTSGNSQKNSNNNVTDNSTMNGLVPSSIGEAAGAGASAASMAWRNASTFSGQLSAEDFNLAISAFEQMQEGKMFSNPRIIVANGKEARVDMTTKEPNVEVTSDRSGTEGQYLSISTKLNTIPGSDRNLFAGEAFFSYGITLSVKPRVSPTGLISVEVVPTISEWVKDKEIKGATTDSAYTTYPIIRMKTINTEFTMKDGATAIIGGLTQTQEQDVDSGIPYLRKIPWIGPKFFGWQSRQKVQTEILVCVTVGIANPESLRKDAGLPTNAVLGREYVEGRRLEPGLRPNAVRNVTEIDTRTLDQIRKDPYQVKDDENAFEDEAKPVTQEPAKPVDEAPAPRQEEPTVEPEQVKADATPPAVEPVADKQPAPVEAPETTPEQPKEPEPKQRSRVRRH